MDIYTTTIAISILVYIAIGGYAGRGLLLESSGDIEGAKRDFQAALDIATGAVITGCAGRTSITAQAAASALGPSPALSMARQLPIRMVTASR